MGWDEVIGASAAWQAAEMLRGRVEELGEGHAGNLHLDRARTLGGVALERLRALDPALASQAHLAVLGERLQVTRLQLEQHLAPAEGVEIDEAMVMGTLDSLAGELTWLPAAVDAERTVITNELRNELLRLRADIDRGGEEAAEALDAMRTSTASELATRDGQLTQVGERIGALDTRLTELATRAEELLATKTAEFDQSRATHEQQHEALRQKVMSDTAALLDGSRQKFEADETDRADAFDQQMTNQQERARAVLQRLEELLSESEEVVGAIGRTSLAGGFHEWEKAEREAADQLRERAVKHGLWAALALAVLIVVRLVAGGDEGSSFDLPLTVGMIALPAALGGIAAYSAHESSRHRRNQVQARRTEIDIKSFGPFLANLEKTQRDEITALFAAVFFGQSSADGATKASANDDVGATPTPLTRQLLERIIEVLAKQAQS